MQSLKVPFLHDELFHLETRKREECFHFLQKDLKYVPNLTKLKCNIRLMTGRSPVACP